MNETETLFTRMLDCDRVSLHLDGKRRLSREQSSFVASVLRRRMAGEPLEYILGDCEFMGLGFTVCPDVLIPRPETELLVESCLRLIPSHRDFSGMIADVCTGSGCIAVSLAKSLSSAKIIAMDVSGRALACARENARRHGVDSRVSFAAADLFDGSGLAAASCAFIVSNPPYVRSADIDGLQPEVRREPRGALDGGADGLDFYRRIAARAPEYLAEGGRLLMEIGAGQADGIRKIIDATGALGVRDVIRDYSGIERVVIAAQR